jgi:hypothetical protein
MIAIEADIPSLQEIKSCIMSKVEIAKIDKYFGKISPDHGEEDRKSDFRLQYFSVAARWAGMSVDYTFA